MNNGISFDEVSTASTMGVTSTLNHANKFVYVKQNFAYPIPVRPEPMRVLINPHFNKKVFINPNFNGKVSASLPKIHINPNAQNITLEKECTKTSKIHVNLKVLRNIPTSVNRNVISDNMQSFNKEKDNPKIVSTRTKLVRSNGGKVQKQQSPFKFIKSSVLGKSDSSETEYKSRYKLNNLGSNSATHLKKSNNEVNKFKLDNRSTKSHSSSPKSKKFVYVDSSNIARNKVLKKNRSKLSLVNISGILYKKSPNSLKRTSASFKTGSLKKTRGNMICKSKYKLTRNSGNKMSPNKIQRIKKYNCKTSTMKMRKCNIPCPYYKKFGRCRGKENGKCFRKHDPNQIALCTKFLQGACVDNKCPLSHNVSPEKMPTCKFYLEGSCFKDDCPYLHVRINPKAEICRDFVEGFCRKAAECDKRHQFLCPEYEKSGTCTKQRCPYPHGEMVRKYSDFNKNNFAKKCSNNAVIKIKENIVNSVTRSSKFETLKSDATVETNPKSRYFIGQLNDDTKSDDNQNCVDVGVEKECGSVKSRPKLGKLPSFIAFDDVQ